MFDAQTIRRMELLILGALKWRMRSVTPFSFFNFFISLFSFKDPALIQALRSRATEIIFKAQNGTSGDIFHVCDMSHFITWEISSSFITAINTLEFNPSILAASALLSASHELFPLQFPCFRKAVSSCTHVNKVNYKSGFCFKFYVCITSFLKLNGCWCYRMSCLDARALC